MTDLDDLYSEIPTQQIAQRLGADEREVGDAVKTLLPVLVGGLQHNAADPGTASAIASAANNHAGLLDGGVDVEQVDEADGSKAVAKIFGGNDTGQVAAALSGGGAGNSDLINKLLPILAPIVLAYLGRKLSGGQSTPGGGDNPLGSILGSVLGGDKGGPLGNILGGLLGGRK
ncbi:DUF937 domain-containing protein [Mycolicibacterium gilvum]|uniref:DUF937 domain-containing protein n=1 Tax=Mycolicibacterium gilvum (strain PYR-GCK) TaxID=350054 RepID=A4T2J7_MYCGI|nr:conserved hypothetical protein [Mycolicibacterium gilvum PYR-GCK]